MSLPLASLYKFAPCLIGITLLMQTACYSPPARLLRYAAPAELYARQSGTELRLHILDEREVLDRGRWLSATRQRGSAVDASAIQTQRFGAATRLPALSWLRIEVFNYGNAPIALRPADFQLEADTGNARIYKPIPYDHFAERFAGEALGALSATELALAPQSPQLFALFLPEWRRPLGRMRPDASTASPAERLARVQTVRKRQRAAFVRRHAIQPGESLTLLLVFEALRANVDYALRQSPSETSGASRLPEMRFRVVRERVPRSEEPSTEYRQYAVQLEERRARRLQRNDRLRRQYYQMHGQLREHDRLRAAGE